MTDLEREQAIVKLEEEFLASQKTSLSDYDYTVLEFHIQETRRKREYIVMVQSERDEKIDEIRERERQKLYAKTEESGAIRRQKFIEHAQSQTSATSYYVEQYEQFKTKGLNFLQQNDVKFINLEQDKARLVYGVLRAIYPTAKELYATDGDKNFPLALDVMENVPWPNEAQMELGFKKLLGWGTLPWAKHMVVKLNKIIAENATPPCIYDQYGRTSTPDCTNYGGWTNPPNDRNPGERNWKLNFGLMSQKEMKDSYQWFQLRPRPGFFNVPNIGYVSPYFYTGAGIESFLTNLYYARKAHQEWQRSEDAKASMGSGFPTWSDVESGLSDISRQIGSVLVHMNSMYITEQVYSGVFGDQAWREADKVTGGLLTQVQLVGTMSARALRGDAITQEDWDAAIDLGIKTGLIVISGGSAAAFIGVGAGYAKQGTLGETTLGQTILGIVEAAGIAYAAGTNIYQAVIDTAEHYAISAAKGEAGKQTGLDQTIMGRIALDAGFAAGQAGAHGEEVYGATQQAVIDTGKEEVAAEVPYGSAIVKYGSKYLPEQEATPQTEEEKRYAESQQIAANTANKDAVISDLREGRTVSVSRVTQLHPEAQELLNGIRQVVPESQVGDAFSMGLDIGLPSFDLGLDLGFDLGIDLPSVDTGIRLPDPGIKLPDPGIKLSNDAIKALILLLLPRGVPLMPVAPRYRYRYVNYVGMDGNLHVRDPLSFSAFEHPMLKAGHVPRHLSSRQRQYQQARLLEVQRAIIQMEQYTLIEADPDTILVSLT